MSKDLSFVGGLLPYSPKNWKAYEEEIREMHINLSEIFPEAVQKLFSVECFPGTEYETYVRNHETTDRDKLKIPDYYPPGLGFMMFGSGTLYDEHDWKSYMDYNTRECPAVGIGFTPNGTWLTHHNSKGLTKLSLKKEPSMTGLNALVFDIDKKDFDAKGIALPPRLEGVYSKWIDVPTDEFFRYYIWRMGQITWNEEISKKLKTDPNTLFFKKMMHGISFTSFSANGLHLFLVIDPKDRHIFDGYNSDRIERIMKGFQLLFGADFISDPSVFRFNSVIRTPGTRHAKGKKGYNDHEDTFIVTPYLVKKVSYGDTVEDFIPRKTELFELGDPFDLDINKINYTDTKLIKTLFDFIEMVLSRKDVLSEISWIENAKDKREYKKLMKTGTVDRLKTGELEIWRAMTINKKLYTDIIRELPGNKVIIDRDGTSMLYTNLQGDLIRTHGYKFNPLPFIPYTQELGESILKKEFGSTFNIKLDDGMEVTTNYCGGYVNDGFSQRGRPSGPILAFLYNYFKQYVCSSNAISREIWMELKMFLEKILPGIDPELISDFTPVGDVIARYGTPNEYIIVTNDGLYVNYPRETSAGKKVETPSKGYKMFHEPVLIADVRFNKRVGDVYVPDDKSKTGGILEYVDDEGRIHEVREDGQSTTSISVTLVVEEYSPVYMRKVKRKIPMPRFATMKEAVEYLAEQGLTVHGDDETLKHFYRLLKLAVDESAPSYSEFGVPAAFGHTGSGFYKNNKDKSYSVLGTDLMLGEGPDYIDAIDDGSAGIFDKSLKEISFKDARELFRRLGKEHVYLYTLATAASGMAMQALEGLDDRYTLGVNTLVIGSKASGKTVLLNLIKTILGYKKGKREVDLTSTTMKPLTVAGQDPSILFIDENTAVSDRSRIMMSQREDKLRAITNKGIDRKGTGSGEVQRKLSAGLFVAGESEFQSESLRSRYLSVYIKGSDRYNDIDALNEIGKSTAVMDILRYWMRRYDDPELLRKEVEEARKEVEKILPNADDRQVNALSIVSSFVKGMQVAETKDVCDWFNMNKKRDPGFVDESDPRSLSKKASHYITELLTNRNGQVLWFMFDEREGIYKGIPKPRTRDEMFHMLVVSLGGKDYDQNMIKARELSEMMPGLIKVEAGDRLVFVVPPKSFFESTYDMTVLTKDPQNPQLKARQYVGLELCKIAEQAAMQSFGGGRSIGFAWHRMFGGNVAGDTNLANQPMQAMDMEAKMNEFLGSNVIKADVASFGRS